MAIDRVEFMTLDTLPSVPCEVEVQLNILKQLALHPEFYRLVFFHLPADIRLHAMYALINKWKNEYDVHIVNIADFTQELVSVITKGTWLSDLKHYEEPDILLIDDLQFMTGKESTQEIFYSAILKPRLQAKKITILFSEYPYETLCVTLRDDLRNLLKLGFHDME